MTEKWEPTEEEIADYLETIYDPDFDLDWFAEVRENKEKQ